jgi:hypothetical protein
MDIEDAHEEEVEMIEWYGTKIILDGKVESIEPLPQFAQDFFKSYAKVLGEVYNGKEMDSEDAHEEGCASRRNGNS